MRVRSLAPSPYPPFYNEEQIAVAMNNKCAWNIALHPSSEVYNIKHSFRATYKMGKTRKEMFNLTTVWREVSACIMYRLAAFKAGCFTFVAWIEQLIVNDFPRNFLYIKLTLEKFYSYSGNKLAEVDSNASVCDCQLRRERLLKLLTGAWKISRKSFLPSDSNSTPEYLLP